MLSTGCVIAWWLPSGTDHAAVFDQVVDEEWMSERETVDAEDFFRRGGRYESLGAEKVDQHHVVPLIQRLKTEHEVQALVLQEGPQAAFAIVVEVPADQERRNAIRRTILDADDRFSGVILQSWGKRWLSLDFLEEAELGPLIEADALEAIQMANRRME